MVRDTPEVMRLVERLVQNVDLPDPEVMLDLQVMEVSSNKLDQLGLGWPTTINYGLPAASTATLVDSRQGLRWSAANPLVVATLKGSSDATNLLANPKIRARNKEKAKVLLGEKLPVFTTTSTANVGVSASVSYLDVGLKLDIEPVCSLTTMSASKWSWRSAASRAGRGAQWLTGLSGRHPAGFHHFATERRRNPDSGGPHQRPGKPQLGGHSQSARHASGRALVRHHHRQPQQNRSGAADHPAHRAQLTQPAAAGSAMPSGTEAQPGALALFIQSGRPAQKPGVGRAGCFACAACGGGGARAAANAQVVRVSRTRCSRALHSRSRSTNSRAVNTAVVYDAGVLDAADAKASGGRVPVEVPPRGSKAVTLSVRAAQPSTETAVSLDAGGAPWLIRIRDPRAAQPADVPSEGSE